MLWEISSQSPVGLAEQIAAAARRGIADEALAAGEQLPPAAELARALNVNRNTVLAAYRTLRDEGLVEFRRGRGVRVTSQAVSDAPVLEAARAFVDVATRHGYAPGDLPTLLSRIGAHA